jgi:outer membrane protein assembly factor BamB
MKPTRLAVTSCVTAVLLSGQSLLADWPEWRGPKRDGTSTEKNLPASWAPAGDNLAWKVPYGGRSGPVVFGDRVYLHTGVGTGDSVQERLVALDANTGKLVWERRLNVFHSDVPAHRTGWASPSVDPDTGVVYTFGVGGLLTATTPAGKPHWHRSLSEEYGLVSTHGGRTVSPMIEGNLVIVNALCVGWGDLGRGGNRWFAFDKTTGATVWVSSPQKKHYDTNMSPGIVTTVNGMKLLIVGGTDGTFHALKVNTGEQVWEFEVSKRAILTGAVVSGTTAFITHSEENLDTSEMGMLASLDVGAKGALTRDKDIKWFNHGFQGGFASPVTDGERLYIVDNGAILGAFDLKDGRKAWEKILGTIQKSSPVLADGKLYIGTENGKFYILKPTASGVEVLDEDWLGSQEAPEPVYGSPAVSGGRVFVTSAEATYAIGKSAPTSKPVTLAKPAPVAPSTEAPAVVQVSPYEVLLSPGEKATFKARLFDAKGNFIREDKATWALDQLGGAIVDGVYTASSESEGGYIKATVGAITGQARVRVVPPLPWSFDFDSWTGEAPPKHWTNTTGKVFVRDFDGSKGLTRVPDATPQRRTRVFMGPSTWSNYTVEADVRVTEKRRTMSDVGVIAQRYGLVLFGNSQKIELEPWQAVPGRSAIVPFAWKPDTWYRMKLQVQNEAGGVTVARGKVWPRGEAEPAAWTIEKKDAIGHREGAPGLYFDPANEIYMDNVKVGANK